MAITKGFGPSYARIFKQNIIQESVNDALRFASQGQMQKDLATGSEEDMNKRQGAIVCGKSVCDGKDIVKF